MTAPRGQCHRAKIQIQHGSGFAVTVSLSKIGVNYGVVKIIVGVSKGSTDLYPLSYIQPAQDFCCFFRVGVKVIDVTFNPFFKNQLTFTGDYRGFHFV